MKLLAALAVVLLALVPVACGGSDSDSTQSKIDAEVEAYLSAPKIERPPGPEPKKVVYEDIKVGPGPVAERGDQVTLHYIAETFRSEEDFSRRWKPAPPVVYPRLGEGPYDKLEKGIEGMREGGRRTVIVPEYEGVGAVIYIVDMEKVEPAAEKGAGANSNGGG